MLHILDKIKEYLIFNHESCLAELGRKIEMNYTLEKEKDRETNIRIKI